MLLHVRSQRPPHHLKGDEPVRDPQLSGNRADAPFREAYHGADAGAGGDRGGRRKEGIDSLVRVCQEKLSEDPIRGCVFIFRSRRGTSIRLLAYDGQGYWLAQMRLSHGKFR